MWYRFHAYHAIVLSRMSEAACGYKLLEFRGEQSPEQERQTKHICLRMVEGFADSFEIFDETFPLIPKGGILQSKYDKAKLFLAENEKDAQNKALDATSQ